MENLGDLKTKIYIAALGEALLAKATDDQVDSLVQDIDAVPRGYSLRMVTELLAERNHGLNLDPPPVRLGDAGVADGA